MVPVGVVGAEEEMFAGDDEDFLFFEALVEFGGGDGEAGEPEPEEEGAFGNVHVPREGFAEDLVGGLAGDA